MVLIYSHITSTRLHYICHFIFKELMGVEFLITVDSEEFKTHNGIKINYSDREIDPVHDVPAFNIQGNSLLFDEIIIRQEIICFDVYGTKAFFRTHNSDFPFDIFAASFYLVTRYEEYLPHEKDMYGRYDHKNSLAFKEGFLNLPLVNIWVKDFTIALQRKFPSFSIQHSAFKIIPTYDIDIAYSYKHKDLLRNLGGFLRSPSVERIKVLLGLQKDPFDMYDWLHELHKRYHTDPICFFLVAERTGQYDKNILPHKEAMWELVKQHAKRYTIGLHPSWQSGDNTSLLKEEKLQLEAMAGVPISRSRQHYIRFNLPAGYNKLIEAGITDDYSMGYGSINGFRASVASSFFWYDLENEEQTNLRIHPFCFMDANAYYEQKQTAQQTAEEMKHYLSVCKKINGTLITIWHNNFLGTAKEFKGWKDIYEEFITLAQQ